jgi:UDP-glucose 4-epimerase
MNVLIVGGAGYIGSFMNRLLVERGYRTAVLDNLSTGHRSSVGKDTEFIEGDLSDYKLLMDLLGSGRFDAVMHFSAFSLVGESVGNPLKYYYNNVSNTINLLKAMKSSGVRHFIFSSTAAVFGNPEEIPIPEDHPVRPINPYGWSKSMVEQILRDLSVNDELHYVSLRYFNAAGADPEGSMGEDHRNETHLIPLVMKAVLGEVAGGRPLTIFGTDYDTPDGTCIRDYIHVIDLAEAHILALNYLADGGKSEIFNLGNGRGFSVQEVIRTAEKVIGKPVPVVEGERRPGDPAVLVASSEKIKRILGWRPRYADLETIIETAWRWHSNHPGGYGD